jgi:hypothetical protein
MSVWVAWRKTCRGNGLVRAKSMISWTLAEAASADPSSVSKAAVVR